MKYHRNPVKGIRPASFTPFLRGYAPRQLVIQVTDLCNAQCPQCGMNVTNRFKRSSLEVDDVKIMIDHASANGFEAISFTGGEPLLLLDEICSLINYAHQSGIHLIRTGTNGYLFRNPESPTYLDRV
jgi:molybdenum cofactor biosynthesis enzyme MoaA